MINEGYMPFKDYKTYYRIVNPEGKKTPLILIHGGPGSTHNYFEVFDDIVLVKANLAELYEKYNKYDKFEELCIDILEKMILLFTNNPKFYERSLKKTINYINSFLQAHKIENEKLFNMCVNASNLLAKYEQKIKRRKLYY